MLPNVLIVHPDLAIAARLHHLVSSGGEAEIGFDDSFTGALTTLDGYSHLDLCVCDFPGPDRDVTAFLDKLRDKFPRVRLIVVAKDEKDVAGGGPEGAIVFTLPMNEARFVQICLETFALLEGREFPPFRLGRKFRSDRWGDWYEAYDSVLKRDVYITVIHSWASEADSQKFRAAATLMARAAHTQVQSVYLAGEHEGRHFVCHEKWDMPSLTDMEAVGHKITPRLAAQILHTVGSVLTFWNTEGYPHAPIGPGQVTLSPQGVIKVANCVDPVLPITPVTLGSLVPVAEVVQRLLSANEQMPPLLDSLLDRILTGEHVILNTTMGEIDIEMDRVRAPITVENFFHYVDNMAYDGTIFHHIMPSFVVQGGRFTTEMQKIPEAPPIPNEASNGVLNLRGTVAMARSSDPNSATSQFAFNLLDNKTLNPSQKRPGYAVFGRVVRGMDVVDEIAQVQTTQHGVYHYMPVEQVVILSARRREDVSVARVIEEAQEIDIQLAPKQEISRATKSLFQRKTTRLLPE